MKYFKTLSNEIYAYEADGSQDGLIASNMVQITEQEATQIIANKTQQDFNELNYSQKRASEYPSFADQFDTIFHQGIDAWKAQIQAVKDKYPKGAE